jgi:hypothetical protein
MANSLPKGFYVLLPTPSGVQRWRVAYRRQQYFGWTDWPKKTIWLAPNQSREELLDTLIHESAHVATGLRWDSAEDMLRRIAAGATALLLKAKLLIPEDGE